MKAVQDVRAHRRDEQARGGDEDDAAIKRIDAREELGGVVGQRVNGPHTAEEHRRILKCVDPSHRRQPVVSRHADRQRDAQAPPAATNTLARRCATNFCLELAR